MSEQKVKKSRGRRILRNTLIVLAVLAVLFVGLDIYGRQGYDPVGEDTVSFDQNKLTPGVNDVEYLSNGSRISADIYIPTDFVVGEQRPIVIITPPNTGVKEQTAGLYASRLVEEGYITLAFDPRGFGESGGHHVLFDLERQIEDVRSTVDFVTTLDMVDQDNIFNMGICVGSAISTYETAYDERIKAQIMVSPVFLTPEENIMPLPMDVGYAMAGAGKLFYYITGNDMELGPLVVDNPDNDNEPETNLGSGMDDYYLEGKPGYAPTWENHFSMISMKPVMEWYDFFVAAEEYKDIPVYMVYGTEAFSRHGASKFFDMVEGDKERLILEGAGHFDIYWMPEYVDPAVEGVTAFIEDQVN